MKFMKTYEGLRTAPKQQRLMNEIRTAITMGTNVDVEALVKKGLDVNVRKEDSIGDTPLIYAIKTEAKPKFTLTNQKVIRKIIEDLIKNGADVNLTNDAGKNGQQSPLIIAALWGSDIEIIKMLIDAGANINYEWEDKNFYGCALQNHHEKLIKWIEKNYPALVSTKRFDL